MFGEMKELKNGVEIPVLALGTWLEKIKDYGEFGFFPVFGGKL